MTRLTLLTLAVWLISAADAAKILVFMCDVLKSHHIAFHPVILKLAQRGHEVDYYTHYPIADPPKTLKHIVFPVKGITEVLSFMETCSNERGYTPLPVAVHQFRKMKSLECSTACLLSSELAELLTTNRTYDMVIGEFSMAQEEYAVLIHKFKALGVAIQSLTDFDFLNEISGLPSNPSYQIHFLTTNTHPMSFVQRLYNFAEIMLSKLVDYYYLTGPLQRLADEHLRYEGWETRPPLSMMLSDLALILVSGHPSLGYPYPKAPHVKEVLGTNIIAKPPPLPQDIQEFMDSAEHGVIFFSLGSMASVKMLKQVGGYEPLLKVFSNLKQKVLWKWTSYNESQPPIVPNIKFSKWFPQQSILVHNKTKLFLTHGGLGGLTEAVYYGVPMIGLPVFTDQHKNVKLMTGLGLGVSLSLNSLTEATISGAIEEVLGNSKYKEAVLQRSAMFKDRPMQPIEESVYWIEYVLRYGNVLQPASSRTPFYQLYLLDVVGFYFVICIVALLILYRALQGLGRVVRHYVWPEKSKTLQSKKRDMKKTK